MIVKKLESPIHYRRKRQSMAGKGFEKKVPVNRSFDEYLLEAFQGEVVQQGKDFSKDLSDLTKDNLIHLSRI